MTFKYHKKIQRILKEANLPKNLSDDLKKELESHFYEKEHELRFSGLKEDEIQKQINEDFGNDELVANHLSFVHKKTFYSFIKSLMKNENKPYIFETIFLFVIVFFLYQNTAWDMATQVQIDRMDNIRAWTEGGFINLGLFLVLNFILVLRLFRGRALSQKLTASLLFVVMLGQMVYTYSLVNRHIIISYDPFDATDRELIENPEKYYERNEGQFISHTNFKYGYQITVPQSYVAFLRDGTMRFPIDLKGDEDIVAFGPPYGSDNELITISILDSKNSPDKSADESWFNYYLNKKFKANDINFTQKELPTNNNDSMAIVEDEGIAKKWYFELSEKQNMRDDILLVEKHDRLYELLLDVENPVHYNIFFNMHAFNASLPESEINWITFDHPACPFTLQLPNGWMAYGDSKTHVDGFFEDGFLEKFIAFEDVKDCNFKGFKSTDTHQNIEMKHIKEQTLDDYLKLQDYFVIQEGDTQWQGLPAKRILFGINNRGTGDYADQVIDSNVRASAFAVQIKENEWLFFSSWYHPTTPMHSDQPMNKIQEVDFVIPKIINSLKIKTPDKTPQEN